MEGEVVLSKRGSLTLPKDVRERNHFVTGTRFQIIDLGQGIIALHAGDDAQPTVACDSSRAVDEAGVTLEP